MSDSEDLSRKPRPQQSRGRHNPTPALSKAQPRHRGEATRSNQSQLSSGNGQEQPKPTAHPLGFGWFQRRRMHRELPTTAQRTTPDANLERTRPRASGNSRATGLGGDRIPATEMNPPRSPAQLPDLTRRSTTGATNRSKPTASPATVLQPGSRVQQRSNNPPAQVPSKTGRRWGDRSLSHPHPVARDLTVLQAEDGTPLKTQPPARRGRSRSPRLSESQPLPVTGKKSSPRRPQPRPVPRTPRSPGVAAALYAARMVILSIGVSVLAGTMLSVWDPAARPLGGVVMQSAMKAPKPGTVAQAAAQPTAQMAALSQEIAPLKAAMQSLMTQTTAQHGQIQPAAFVVDLDTSTYVDVNGGATIAAASTIKIPVLIAFFQDVDAGKIRLDEMLTLKQELIGSGSGELQYLPVGSQFSALEVATRMITISDNTATNMLIAKLGGIAAVNQRFKAWGLSTTLIHNPLPDLEGTNLTSPKELAMLLARVSQGELVSLRSRDRILDIMRKTVTDSLLPQGLGEGATIAHKTGDIGTVLGDIGLVDLPNGKRYAIGVLVKRPFNDGNAGTLIQQLSRTAYQHFTQPTGATSKSAPGATPNAAVTGEFSNPAQEGESAEQ